MKYFSVILLFAAAYANKEEPEDGRIPGENGWYIPRLDNVTEWVDIDDADAYIESHSNATDVDASPKIKFYLYTKNNPHEPQLIDDNLENLQDSNFNVSHPTRISIHGWQSGRGGFINKGIGLAWLSTGEYNFIFVEWDAARSLNYVYSFRSIHGVAERLATMIRFLVDNSHIKLDDLVICGHSLGAHIAGLTGKYFTDKKIYTIVGLDPAAPLFKYNNTQGRLTSTDASYVQSIHTNGARFGFLRPIGGGSFYPNGGRIQPGCPFDITHICDHSSANYYYAEAIELNDFGTYECESYLDAVAKNCSTTCSPVLMGATTEKARVEGIFYVPVQKSEPYGIKC